MGMSAIKCELCGSTELTRREDGFFQCDCCGTKYSLESARQLMQGTVRVDESDKVEKLILRAADLMAKGEHDTAILRLEKALSLDPRNERALSLLEKAQALSKHGNLEIEMRVVDGVFSKTFKEVSVFLDGKYICHLNENGARETFCLDGPGTFEIQFVKGFHLNLKSMFLKYVHFQKITFEDMTEIYSFTITSGKGFDNVTVDRIQ